MAARRDFIIVLLDFGPAPLLDGGGKLRRTNYFRRSRVAARRDFIIVLLNFDPAHLLDCGDAERTIFAGVGWQPGGILS